MSLFCRPTRLVSSLSGNRPFVRSSRPSASSQRGSHAQLQVASIAEPVRERLAEGQLEDEGTTVVHRWHPEERRCQRRLAGLPRRRCWFGARMAELRLQARSRRDDRRPVQREAVRGHRDLRELRVEERTRERAPAAWATTQINLGSVLLALGNQEHGTDRLVEAVAAYRAALTEYTPEQMSYRWAATQNNLGNALRALGEREESTELLNEAITAFRASLEVRTIGATDGARGHPRFDTPA